MQMKKMMENLRRKVGPTNNTNTNTNTTNTTNTSPSQKINHGSSSNNNNNNGVSEKDKDIVEMDKDNKDKDKPKSSPSASNSTSTSISVSASSASSSSSSLFDMEKQTHSHYNEADLLADLPLLRDTSDPAKKRALFIKKLNLCCVLFDFVQPDHSPSHQLASGTKRQCLIELVEYISQSKQCFSEDVMPHVIEMLSTNLFRPLPPPLYVDFDPEEDEPNFNASWPHMQFVYEFFHRFVMSVDVKLIRKYMDKKFLARIIDLFNSEDPRERDYLKMILHRVYGRCMPFRSFIRKAINNVLFPIIYENCRHNGVSELLEILGSIINGFALPLKDEHVQFLQSVLIPLHKAPSLPQFHQQLAYCITQFIQKNPSLAGHVLSGMLKYWPVTSCQKEILFLNELEEVLELTEAAQIEKVMEPLFKRIANAISSNHFQVAERALFLWNNDIIATFTSDHRNQVLPIIFPALQHNFAKHWNSTVSSLTLNIIRIFKEMDKELYEETSKKYKTQKGNPEHKAQQRIEKWNKIRERNNIMHVNTPSV